jgi:hypothetical protein
MRFLMIAFLASSSLVACGGVSHKMAKMDTEADAQAAAKPRIEVQPLNP